MATAAEAASLSQRILEHYDDLTRSERRLADHLLQNADLLLLLSASDLSDRAGVSKATTARFFQRMGYPSFKTAQKQAREPTSGPSPEAERIQRFATSRTNISDHLAQDMQNLVRTVEQLRLDELALAIQTMAQAEKLWVVGFGDNYPLAHFARSQLIRVKPDIRMIPIGGFPIPEEFASIQASDTLIGFGIARRSKNLRSIMRSAVTAGAKTILITDQSSRAGKEIATVTLRCRTRGTGIFESAVAAVSLTTYLSSALALRLGQGAIERLEFIDRIHEEWDDLLTEDI